MRIEKRIVLLVILGLFLVIPFSIRFIEKKLEPYPAILMPVGASVQKNLEDDLLVFNGIGVYGYNENDRLVEVDVDKITGAIRHHHFISAAKYNFGLFPFSDTLSFGRIGLTGVQFVEKTKSTAEGIDETKQWFREGLREQGLKDSVIVIRKFEVELDRAEKREISKKNIEEERIELYQ